MHERILILLIAATTLLWSCDDDPKKQTNACGNGLLDLGEQCDGDGAAPPSCEEAGYYQENGPVTCGSDCQWDYSVCEGRCGDDLIQTAFGEQCEGDDLAGVTCQSLGLGSGTLACGATCRFDVTGCAAQAICGDGVLQGEAGEDCDGDELGDETCEGLGLGTGTLHCAADCTFDTSACDAAAGARSVCAGSSHGCALRVDGTVWCWGTNSRGQLGDGTTTSRLFASRVTALTLGAVELVCGAQHTCVALLDGSARCWGDNAQSQLGNGASSDRTTPTQVDGLTSGVVMLSAGDGHTCALKSDGAVWCWGSNFYGQLGSGSIENSAVPVAVSGLASDAVQIAAGNQHTCAVKSDGSAWCWGWNDHGQIGDGTSLTNRLVPTAVTGLGTVVAGIACGDNTTFAWKTDGSAWSWGYNFHGQLGDGSTASRSLPATITGIPASVAVLSGGFDHACALDDAGSTWCWGRNDYGQLGDDSTTNSPTPVQVQDLTEAGRLSAGAWFSCAVKTDGTVWCWGSNGYGELGDGTDVDRLTPVPVLFQ